MSVSNFHPIRRVRFWHGKVQALCTILTFTLTWAPVSVHADKTSAMEQTKLTVPIRDPANSFGFPDITPDGRYIELTDTQTNKSWLVSMDGRRYSIPGQGFSLYDSTPNGDVIFRYSVGAAPLAFVFRPGTGVVRRFPGKGDKFAAATHFASESSRSHWLECMSNVPGGNPLKELWYDIDDKTVPLLQNTLQASWSPNGIDLAAVVGSSSDSSAWLVLYHTKTRQRETCGNFPVILPDPTLTTQSAPSWSVDGRFVAMQSSKGWVIYDTETKKTSSVDVDLSSNQWGWGSDHQLFVMKRLDDHTAFLQYYGVKNGMWVSTDQLKIPHRVHDLRSLPDGRILVKTVSGSIMVIDGLKQSLLVKTGADRFWFDEANDYAYFGVRRSQADNAEPVFRVKVPDPESARTN